MIKDMLDSSVETCFRKYVIPIVILTVLIFLVLSTVIKTPSIGINLLILSDHCGLWREDINSSSSSESRHVAFVKVHKTGSTTIQNVIQRFGLCRNLAFALPPKGATGFSDYGRLHYNSVLPLKVPNSSYDIICNHVVYNRDDFHRLLPTDTKYISIVRNPFDQFVSAYRYYYHNSYYEILLPHNISKYLERPSFYDILLAGYGYTNNRMAYDLGLSTSEFHNKKAVDDFISALEKDFELIMIMERMDESLLLIKRYLKWTLADILYVPNNANTDKTFSFNFTDIDRQRHRLWDAADYAMFAHFSRRFQNLIEKESDFQAELLHYRDILNTVREFCEGQTPVHRDTLRVQSSPWNSVFYISVQYCSLLHLGEVQFVNAIREYQYPD